MTTKRRLEMIGLGTRRSCASARVCLKKERKIQELKKYAKNLLTTTGLVRDCPLSTSRSRSPVHQPMEHVTIRFMWEGTVTSIHVAGEASAPLDHFQRREDHWAIVDLVGKGGHIRTVPMPDCVKQTIDGWLAIAQIAQGKIFRCVCRTGTVWGTEITPSL